jgi:hypothetical protein
VGDQYTIAPDLVHEVFQDEVIIADLERGLYYSLEGVGIDVWTGLERRESIDRIVAALAQSCSVDEASVAPDVERLIKDLNDEALIRPLNGEPVPAAPASEATVTSTTYRAPRLQRYDDMQQILLLDPIHEVSDQGWPHLPPQP